MSLDRRIKDELGKEAEQRLRVERVGRTKRTAGASKPIAAAGPRAMRTGAVTPFARARDALLLGVVDGVGRRLACCLRRVLGGLPGATGDLGTLLGSA
jgi:hypothetical protein